MVKAKIVGIIPARYGSSRFPGKPLVPILGKSLIQRTYENARRCTLLDELYVATDDQSIFDHVVAFGGKGVMTPVDCPTGSDRMAAALEAEPVLNKADIVINIQGDWPLLDPQVVDAVTRLLQNDPQAVMSTAVVKIEGDEDLHASSLVKCVMDQQGNALYFSRSMIPGNNQAKRQPGTSYYKHLGIYGFTREFLVTFAKLPSTPLQLAEDLEQLKALEHGYQIKTAIVDQFTIGVDTPEDVKKVEQLLCKQNTSL